MGFLDAAAGRSDRAELQTADDDIELWELVSQFRQVGGAITATAGVGDITAALPEEAKTAAIVTVAASQTEDSGAVLVTNVNTGLTHFLAGGAFTPHA